jgi:hypothetical protein
MGEAMDDKETIFVVTADAARGVGLRSRLKLEELSENVNLFLDQMGTVLSKAPPRVGAFQFVEFEVHAEISAKGTLALLGTGGEAGATGGVKFVFRRATAPA